MQDCLIKIVTHCELYKRPQTFWEWARNLLSMAKQHSGKDFCEILTAMGETHSRTFLIALALENENEAHVWTASGLIELLLECSEQEGRYPTEETRSCIPFGFWYALQDDLATLDQPFENRALQVLKPIYFRLAQALLRKSALPASQSEGGDDDERELFRCYRQDAADTLDYCYSVLGDDLLALLGQRLSQSLEDVPWTYVESTLQALRALAESVGTREYCYIPALLDLILGHIPYHLYPEEVHIISVHLTVLFLFHLAVLFDALIIRSRCQGVRCTNVRTLVSQSTDTGMRLLDSGCVRRVDRRASRALAGEGVAARYSGTDQRHPDGTLREHGTEGPVQRVLATPRSLRAIYSTHH